MEINISKLLKDCHNTKDEKSTGYHYRQNDRSNLTDPNPFLYIYLEEQAKEDK